MRVVGCVGLHVPEELLHAAGLHPALLPESEDPITVGADRLQVGFCGYIRSVVDVGLKHKLDFLDGMVMHDVCMHVRAAHGILERNSPQVRWQECFWFPPDLHKPRTRAFVVKEMADLKHRVELHAGGPIADGALHNSIRLYNRFRGLLQRLDGLRRSKPGVLSASQFIDLVQAGMLIPKEEYCGLLARVIGEVEATPSPPLRGPRLVLSGHLCGAPPAEIARVLDELGAAVVADDLWTGSWYFATEVPERDDPLEGLVDAYVHMTPVCPTRHRDDRDLGDHLLEIVRRSDASGVVFLIMKFCEPHYYAYPAASKKLRDAGIPEMLLETERESASKGQVETRLQAFVEAIQGT